jgi:hypothetical protein
MRGLGSLLRVLCPQQNGGARFVDQERRDLRAPNSRDDHLKVIAQAAEAFFMTVESLFLNRS